MNGAEIRRALDAAMNTHEQRDYLGMSQIGYCVREIYFRVTDGKTPESAQNLNLRRLQYLGILYEQDAIARLEAQGVKIDARQRELVAPFDDRFRGHIDGEIDGDLLEIKTVYNQRAIQRVRAHGVLSRHSMQIQAYMRYGEYERAQVLYIARDSGQPWVVTVLRSEQTGEDVEAKARRILAALDRKRAPSCQCGKCGR